MEKLRSVHSLTLNDRVKNQTERGVRTPVTIKVGVEDYNQGTPPRLSSAVRNLSAGILLLCKEKLRRLSPIDEILIWKNIKPAIDDGKVIFVKSGSQTVDVHEIRERLRGCNIDCEIDLLERIARVRNSIEHHYVEDPSVVRGAFVDGLRFLTRFMPEHLGADLREEIGEEAWETLLGVKEIDGILREQCAASYAEIKWHPILKKIIRHQGCPDCSSHLIRQADVKNRNAFTATWQCAACGCSDDHQTWVARVLHEHFAGERFIAAKDGGEDPVETCPECGEEAFLHDVGMCMACGLEYEGGECEVCGETLGIDDYGESICSYHRYVAERERDR